MISKIINYIKFLKKVNIIQFFYLNYFCDAVIRMDNSKIIPYKNAVIDIADSSKIYLSGGDIEIGCDKLKKSKAETRVRLRENAVWSSAYGAKISYGTTFEILNNAIINSKFFTINSNCTMVAAKRIDIGKDVMIGRNVVIYDSDFHQLVDIDGKITNLPSIVSIGDHVWIATNAMVTKGAQIGAGAMIGANSIVNGTIRPNTMYYTKTVPVTRENYGSWNRKRHDL